MVAQNDVHQDDHIDQADQPAHEPAHEPEPDTDAIGLATRRANARAVYEEVSAIVQWFRTAPGPRAIELGADNGWAPAIDSVPKYLLQERIRHAEEYIAKSNRLAELITVREHWIKFHLSHLATVPMPVADAIIARGVDDEIVCANTPNGAEPANIDLQGWRGFVLTDIGRGYYDWEHLTTGLQAARENLAARPAEEYVECTHGRLARCAACIQADYISMLHKQLASLSRNLESVKTLRVSHFGISTVPVAPHAQAQQPAN